MSGAHDIVAPDHGESGKELATLWADITRSVALLPPSNHRLVSARERFFAALDAVLGTNASVPILVHAGTIYVGDTLIDVGEIKGMHWLEKRLHRSILAGVEFERGVTEESFLAFTARLLENWTANNRYAGFGDLWTETYPGIRLVELRYSLIEAGGDVRSLLDEDDPTTDASHVERILRRDPACMEEIAQLRRSISFDGSGDWNDVNVISRIASILPRDALENETKVVALTRSVIATLTDEVGALGGAGHSEELAGLEVLLQKVSRKFFGRDVYESTNGVTTPELERLEPDLVELLAKIDALPARSDDLTNPDTFESDEEALDTGLYFLCNHSSEEAATRLRERLVRSVSSADPASQAILEKYVESARSQWESGGDARPIRRVVELLRVSSRAIAPAGSALLQRTLVVKTFPELFLQYLDGIDIKNGTKRRELTSTCHEIGVRRILAAKEALTGNGGLRAPGRAGKVLSVPHESLLPLVHLIIEDEGEDRRDDVIEFFRALKFSRRESVLCRIESPLIEVPCRYLSLLARDARTEYTDEMRDLISDTLCAFLDASNDARSEQESRRYAIAQLGRFPTRKAEDYLERLSRGRRIFSAKVDRQTREVAMAALNAIRGSR